jgi:hypothetical protein
MKMDALLRYPVEVKRYGVISALLFWVLERRSVQVGWLLDCLGYTGAGCITSRCQVRRHALSGLSVLHYSIPGFPYLGSEEMVVSTGSFR